MEAGGIGGLPAGGLSFGAVTNPQAVIDQPYMFDFYDGGGLDQAFLGMAEVDADGNVNVSRFTPKLAGPGGFINISQSAKAVWFMGTFTAGATVVVGDGRLQIVADTATRRFVRRLQQRTFSGAYRAGGAAGALHHRAGGVPADRPGLLLTEIAPGVDLERDVLAHMGFTPIIASDLREMDPRIFRNEPMGLSRHSLVDLADRLVHHAEDNVLYVNLEGLHVDTTERRGAATSWPAGWPGSGSASTPSSTTTTSNSDRRRGHLLHHDPRQHREVLPQRDPLLHERLLPPPTRPTLHRAQLGQTIYPSFAAAREGTRE